MARKDKILSSFLAHPMLIETYNITPPLPNNVREALDSKEPIIAAIARIVEAVESSAGTSEATVYKIINQYLNSCAL